VRFCYEWHNEEGQWFRAYGNENWEFDALGYMAVRHASINDVPITDAERLFHWPQGRRPDDHPGLTELRL
jgi:nuclear transport factor 2 (NTF2) superfamily protein